MYNSEVFLHKKKTKMSHVSHYPVQTLATSLIFVKTTIRNIKIIGAKCVVSSKSLSNVV